MKIAWTLALLALAAPAALAQEQDPTVNESDFNTTAPPPDEQYLDEAQAQANGDPTLTDSDFDMSAPPDDDAYLDEAEAEIAASDATPSGGSSGDRTPGLGLLVTLGAVAAIALSVGARR